MSCQKTLGIEPLEEVIDVRSDKFLKRYCATDNYLCRLINARHQLNSGSILFYLCAVVFFLLVLFVFTSYCIFVLPCIMVK